MSEHLHQSILSDTKEFLASMHKQRDFVYKYARFRDKIRSYFLYRLHGNTMLADDLTSVVFLKAYDKFDSYEDVYAFSTWLYTIARNTLTDHLRSQKQTSPIEFAEHVEDEHADFYAIVDAKLDAQHLQELMKELPEAQREAVFRYHLLYETHDEIAGHMGKSNDAVRQLISRGCRALRTMMEDQQSSPS